MDTKTCIDCGLTKPISEYYFDKRNGAYRNQCKTCRVAKQSAYQRTADGKVAVRRAKSKHLYNLTPAQYDALLEAQGGGCAICKAKAAGNGDRLFSVDHDHACCPGMRSCGKCVRGLLCLRCNNNLGWMETWLPQVKEYLDAHGVDSCALESAALA